MPRTTSSRWKQWSPPGATPLLGSIGKSESSASALVERGIVLVFVVLRVGLIVQLLLTVYGYPEPSPPAALTIVTLIAVGFSCVLVAVVLVSGQLSPSWGMADLAVAGVAIVACGTWTPPQPPSADTYNWAVGYAARSVPFIAAWNSTLRVPLLASVGVATVYLITGWQAVQPHSTARPQNAVDLVIYAITTAIFSRYSRLVAERADRARLRAVELGTDQELARYQHQIHNATGLLARLARPDTPADLLPALREQAGQESNRLRHEFLTGATSAGDHTGDTASLDSVVWDACAGFTGLPLRVSARLGRGVRLSESDALVVHAALVALLYNVEFHAHADNVTIHASGDDTQWEISVADDGVGFDPSTTRHGYGLARQVRGPLLAQGMTIEIDSQEGAGTCITICGAPERG